ncbi:mechanosensitive ion channel [Flavobacterium sp. MAH-1]|uniref:Mechanosensitive ion channel n=1 Tax=Flavobacterium agri TaxID=2743471 RepID=A0A7Y8XZS5_9FLAO|nr:mechanosensitive ion channel domain-containing protein [Flavobacterium agri]NUY79780.1 mechanosensitive ion channel [Flavobacterium agri]NYA69805.1 mechanosensitive ion channel [Flavobacterium agri]
MDYSNFIIQYSGAIISTIILLVVVMLVRYFSTKAVKKYAVISEILEHRANLVIKYISVLLTVITMIAIIVIWGVDTDYIITTLSGVLAVIGVALFAQWSILSNITSGIILLFSFPFKIGDIIRIHDKDFPIEAEIDDIRTFHTLLKTQDGQYITYPNNLLLQKGITIVKNWYEPQEFTD